MARAPTRLMMTSDSTCDNLSSQEVARIRCVMVIALNYRPSSQATAPSRRKDPPKVLQLLTWAVFPQPQASTSLSSTTSITHPPLRATNITTKSMQSQAWLLRTPSEPEAAQRTLQAHHQTPTQCQHPLEEVSSRPPLASPTTTATNNKPQLLNPPILTTRSCQPSPAPSTTCSPATKTKKTRRSIKFKPRILSWSPWPNSRLRARFQGRAGWLRGRGLALAGKVGRSKAMK